MKKSLNIIQITDLHVAIPPRNLPDSELTTEDSLSQILDAVSHESPELILCTGDLTNHPGTRAYERLRQLMSGTDCPVYCLPGNHDDPEMGKRLTETPDSPMRWYRTIEHAPWLIVMLDSHVEGKIYGRLPPDELRFLQETLESHPDRHTLVCLHHHPVPMESEWLDGHILKNPAEFFTIIDQHPQVRAIAWGHVHQEYIGQRGDVQLIGTPSTCFQFLPGSDDFAFDTRPPAYRRLSLSPDGKITTKLIYRELTL